MGDSLSWARFCYKNPGYLDDGDGIWNETKEKERELTAIFPPFLGTIEPFCFLFLGVLVDVSRTKRPVCLCLFFVLMPSRHSITASPKREKLQIASLY